MLADLKPLELAIALARYRAYLKNGAPEHLDFPQWVEQVYLSKQNRKETSKMEAIVSVIMVIFLIGYITTEVRYHRDRQREREEHWARVMELRAIEGEKLRQKLEIERGEL